MSAVIRRLIVDRYTRVWRSPNANPAEHFAGRNWVERLRV